MVHEKVENLPMTLYGSPDGKIRGHIKLSEMASPLTVRVYLEDKEIVPDSFDCFGYPIFSEEQARIYRLKNFEYKKITGENEDLKLEVSYRIDSSWISRSSFDTAAGIEKSLVGLIEFNRVINERKRYIKRHPNETLNSFVVFGRYLLDDRAQLWSIERNKRDKVVTKVQVESLEKFNQNNPSGYSFVRGEKQLVVPKPKSICPCCGKQLTIYDVKDDYCIGVDGKVYHESCYHELEKCNEILEIIVNIVGCAYRADEYRYELLPNGYCNGSCCAHIPWFLVHTRYGDIIIGKRKRVISIEWQENFKLFDMNELFASENVTKWSEKGKQGIHAWTINKAIVYLMKVKDSLEEGE